MANYISKIKLNGTTYRLKDEETKTAVENLQNVVSSSLVLKGVASSATSITSLTNYKIGWTYKANADFTIDNLGKIENGDMIICIADYNSGYKASDWTVVQNNVDTMTGATTSAAGTRGLVPAPNAGETNLYLRSDGTWSSPDVTWGSISSLIS